MFCREIRDTQLYFEAKWKIRKKKEQQRWEEFRREHHTDSRNIQAIRESIQEIGVRKTCIRKIKNKYWTKGGI